MKDCLTDAQTDIDTLCINTIRALSMDAIQKAKSGHPGAPMGMAPAAFVLWKNHLRHNPENPEWYDRDRFVLSAGHASMLLYSLLYLFGYNVSLDDIKAFRQWKSITPGHPEHRITAGVETTTGPLGQGIANAVGMAMAERHLGSLFNRPGNQIVDHYTYVMCGDGDLMEGISYETASLAGHLGLGKLICLYDDNSISIEGNTAITFTEDVTARFRACNWQVISVTDGTHVDAIDEAISTAKQETARPSMIILRTQIAYGSPNKQGSANAHGAPLGEDEVTLTKQCLGCPADPLFCVPETVLSYCREAAKSGKELEARWQDLFNGYQKEFPELAKNFLDMQDRGLIKDWEANIPVFTSDDGDIATRKASGAVINAIADKIPGLIGGSADLGPSNKTLIDASPDFQKETPTGRNLRFGVREHAMGGILNGMILHHGLRPYGGTFLVFADYMRPAIRLAALMKQPVIYIFTHDSISVGEDGPTHQPVEQLASLRAIPNLTVIRPADANETAAAWQSAIMSDDAPVALILSRQKLPIIDRSRYAPADQLKNGAYVLADTDNTPDLILIGTGSEVHICLAAREALAKQNVAVRVVSMPSWELFDRTPKEYQDEVLPPHVGPRIAVEAGIPMGWERYIGRDGKMIGMHRFGASAPGEVMLEKFGFTAENIVETALGLFKKA
ncbi:MAG: transketolase [Desulfobacterales bacterium]|nr:transketolase [Desulfobacterales bacterium]